MANSREVNDLLVQYMQLTDALAYYRLTAAMSTQSPYRDVRRQQSHSCNKHIANILREVDKVKDCLIQRGYKFTEDA